MRLMLELQFVVIVSELLLLPSGAFKVFPLPLTMRRELD
jgi:hypothetical protein